MCRDFGGGEGREGGKGKEAAKGSKGEFTFGRRGATHLSGIISPLAAFHRVSL